MDNKDYLNNADIEVIAELYSIYKSNPEKVSDSWKRFFEGFDFAITDNSIKPNDTNSIAKEFKVLNLIQAYRERGHYFTLTNPVRTRRKYSPTLDIENFGLAQEDLSMLYEAGNEIGMGQAPLADIINNLQITYCKSIGVEYMYIRKPEVVKWLKDKMESCNNMPAFNIDEKKLILKKISEAVIFEKFLQKKFPGQKTFSLAGAESLIPALHYIIEKGADSGAEEFIIGMAHRGRLNVLANIINKPLENIFNEFAGKEYDEKFLLGDVKYHLGYTSIVKTRTSKPIRLNLVPNPSHLESVTPVVQGIARAMSDKAKDYNFDKDIPLLIHGDASIAGQGVVYELLQMSELDAYKTGGTIHIIINNQVGFTTNYLQARSSTYCTDVAKIIQSPIFHVNGDDVEAVVYTVMLALQYREEFKKDVFIDLLCYRRFGHNESDEPRFTQPLLYKIIENHPDTKTIYMDKLIQSGVISHSEGRSLEEKIKTHLDHKFEESQKISSNSISSFLNNIWNKYKRPNEDELEESPDTSVDIDTLKNIGIRLSALPEGHSFFNKTIKLQDARRKMIESGKGLDWSTCELMALGAMLNEGISVRITGQDVERGTFSQRHSVITVQDSEELFMPLREITNKGSQCNIYNSLLSEYAVLGFEYGYSMASPDTFTAWEAQFGDFSNGAQIIIDQYISCAEEKWKLMNNLVIMLPHGYEGQGPEHSSARPERFLSLCAGNNIQVVNCTTPSNYFHVLRRQMKRKFCKPLVIFTPKSLLRHPECVSSLKELSVGGFLEVIDDNTFESGLITKVVFCSGKIYYELKKEQERLNNTNTAIIRVEQLYPFPHKPLKAIIKKYNKAKKWLWVQEEPANMGAWSFVIRKFLEVPLMLIARPDSSSPATGSSDLHKIRQSKIIEKTFSLCNCEKVLESCKMYCAEQEWQISLRKPRNII